MRAAFREAGFVHRPALVPAEALERLRLASAELAFVGGGPYGAICHDPWRRHPAFLEVIRDCGLATLARDVLGRELRLFQDHLIAKPPGGERAISWHQDYSYWPLDRAAGLTMWIALDDAGERGGCLDYVARSHRLGERQSADFADGAAMPSAATALEAIDVVAADREAFAAVARAGDGLLHDPLVWHRSLPNRGGSARRAWSVSWVDSDARWDTSHAPHPFSLELAIVDGSGLDPERFPTTAIIS